MASVRTSTQCFHCGDEASGAISDAKRRSFCCNGCLAVCELLEQSGLQDYYILNEHPGSKHDLNDVEEYQALSDPSVAASFVRFRDEAQTHCEFELPQMHCSSCIWLLENLHQVNEGISDSRVDFPHRRLSLRFHNNRLSLPKVAKLLKTLGYAPNVNFFSLEGGDKRRASGSNLGLRLGIAGFSFGNVMLLSLADYFNYASGNLEFQNFAGGLAVLLSLPVFLFSAAPFWKSAYEAAKRGHLNIDFPITLGIVALFSQSLYEVFLAHGLGYFDSFCALIFFLLIGRLLQEKTYAHLNFERDYRSFFPISVTKIYSGLQRLTPISDLRAGDVVRLRHGELIPADGFLLSMNAEVDYRFVTGESRTRATCRNEAIYAGGRVYGEPIELRLSKAVSQSYLTQLWNRGDTASSSHFETWSDAMASYFVLAVLGMAALTFLFWIGSGLAPAVQAVASVLIVACPCALALTVPFSLGTATNIFAVNGAFVKNTGVLERLAGIRELIFDKTGTLTDPEAVDVEQWMHKPVAADLAHLARLCEGSAHPVSRALSRFREAEVSSSSIVGFREEAGLGLSGRVDSVDFLVGSRKWLESNGVVLPDDFSEGGWVHFAKDGIWLSACQLSHAYRPGLETMFARLRRRGVTSWMLSGDQPRDESFLSSLFGQSDRLRFNQRPEQKREFLADRQSNHNFAMIGDGLNDAHALREAAVGIAVTDDIKTFTPACDIILHGKNLVHLDRLIALARSLRGVVLGGWMLSLFYNVVGLSYAMSGQLSPLVSAILMPVSSITVVAFAFFSTLFVTKKHGLTWKL